MPGAWSALRPELEGVLTPRGGADLHHGDTCPSSHRRRAAPQARAVPASAARSSNARSRTGAGLGTAAAANDLWQQAERSIRAEAPRPPLPHQAHHASSPMPHAQPQAWPGGAPAEIACTPFPTQPPTPSPHTPHHHAGGSGLQYLQQQYPTAATHTLAVDPSPRPYQTHQHTQHAQHSQYAQHMPPGADGGRSPLPISRSAVRATTHHPHSAHATPGREATVMLRGGAAHSPSLISLWRANTYSDVDVIVEGQAFYAHRLVLAAGSDFLAALLESAPPLAMRQRRASVLELPHVSADAFEVRPGSHTARATSPSASPIGVVGCPIWPTPPQFL